MDRDSRRSAGEGLHPVVSGFPRQSATFATFAVSWSQRIRKEGTVLPEDNNKARDFQPSIGNTDSLSTRRNDPVKTINY